MLFNYLLYLQLLISNLIIAEYDHIISISSVLSTPLIFNTEILDKSVDSKDWKVISWYKGLTNLKLLINSHRISDDLTNSRYYLINRTKLCIQQTFLGDEGFYILKLQTKSNLLKEYIYHVVLFYQNLSLFISPPLSPRIHYYAEQKINLTCSISFLADRYYIEQIRSRFSFIWHMIIYNNDPDEYQLKSSSSNSYIYIGSLLNYELNRNDHNQTVNCTFHQQIINLSERLNVEYKAYLRGNYYFIRSFNTHSSIEINCEEFDANPQPIYSLIWSLNGEHQTLLNRTKSGRYFIKSATWRNRGNYTCLAENYLNNHQPVHQSFRLNIWFNTPSYNNILSFEQILPFNRNQSFILILLIVIFVFACLSCILSFYCFCLQIKNKQ